MDEKNRERLRLILEYFKQDENRSDIEEKAARWMTLVDRNKTEEANRFYESTLFDEVIARFTRQESRYARRYSVLISLVGFSPEPLILTIAALQPDYIHFLVTEDARFNVDKIIERCGYPPSRFEQNPVESSSAGDVYKKIYTFVKSAPGKTAIDITGGKKAMVGGAAIAGAFLNCDLFYVDYGHYMPESRKPLPGSEYLNLLSNPYQVFGDVDKRAAIQLYRAGNHAAAIERLKGIIDKLPDEREERLLLNIFEFHKYWEDYEFKRAVSSGTKALEDIGRRGLYPEQASPLRERLELLREMDGGSPALIALNHFEMSRRYCDRQRFNFAVMMLYRTMEKVLTHHLAAAWHIEAASPEYAPYPDLRQKYAARARELYGPQAREELPGKIALMDAFLILRALGDEMTAEVSLKEALAQTNHRNLGILAHGDRPNTYKQYTAMKKIFRPVIERYSLIYFNRPLAETLGRFRPLALPEG